VDGGSPDAVRQDNLLAAHGQCGHVGV